MYQDQGSHALPTKPMPPIFFMHGLSGVSADSSGYQQGFFTLAGYGTFMSRKSAHPSVSLFCSHPITYACL